MLARQAVLAGLFGGACLVSSPSHPTIGCPCRLRAICRFDHGTRVHLNFINLFFTNLFCLQATKRIRKVRETAREKEDPNVKKRGPERQERGPERQEKCLV